MDNKTVANVLRHAVKLMDKKGWVQFVGETDEGRLCASTALFKVSNNGWVIDRILTELKKAFPGVVSITGWNDRPTQTYENVKKTFLDIAEKLSGETVEKPDNVMELNVEECQFLSMALSQLLIFHNDDYAYVHEISDPNTKMSVLYRPGGGIRIRFGNS